ncbi:hypothetical protein FI667_g2975, partial [Globisporangium splendens]
MAPPVRPPRLTLEDALALAEELTDALEVIGQSVHSEFLTPSRSENGPLLQQKAIVFVELENLLDEQPAHHAPGKEEASESENSETEEEGENASTALSIGLQVIARIAQCSYMLTPYPNLKAAFWKKLVTPFFSESEISMVNKWRLEDPHIPRIAFTFPSTSIEEPLMKEMLTFMTTPLDYKSVATAGEEKQDEHLVEFLRAREIPAKSIAFGMWFVNYELQLGCLKLIQRLLDQIFAHPDRQFGVNELYLSVADMDPPVLQLLRDLVAAHQHIPEILVHEGYVQKASELSLDETQNLRSLVLAALNQDPSTYSPLHPETCDQEVQCLQQFSFHSSFGMEHYAAVCSSLRYGCKPSTIAFSSYLSGDVTPRVRRQCWRWLAFSLFYPRSRRFESACNLHTIDLTGTYVQPEDIEAFQNTLRDPAGELLFDGNTELVNSIEPFQLKVGRMAKGVKVFAEAPDSLEPVESFNIVAVVEDESEMEVLYEGTAWTGVVLAGFGLGWVKTDEIIVESEPAVSAKKSAPPCERRFGLIMNDMDDRNTSPAALQALIELVGPRLSSLELRCIARDRSDLLTTICTRCVNLEHLDLENWRLQRSEVDTLLDALSGDLGGRLLSLNLNNNDMGVDGFERFASILSREDKIPALQELRLFCHPLGVFGLVSCIGVLRANKTLRVLELDLPSRTTTLGRVVDTEFPLKCIERDRLDAAFQDELLSSIPVPLTQKLAFLSVLESKSTKPAVRSAVDALVVSLIFKFASQEVRRKICWSRIPT